MIRPLILLTALALFQANAPAQGRVAGFTLVNATGGPLSNLSVRRVGASEWRSLPVAPASGSRIRSSFADEDCAFDLRAAVPGVGPVTWAGVNLCDAKSVTLNRDSAGRTWVDYD